MIDSNGYSDRPLKKDIIAGKYFKLVFPPEMIQHDADGNDTVITVGSCQGTTFMCRKCKQVVDDIRANGFIGLAERDPVEDITICGKQKFVKRLNAILQCKYLDYDFPF